MTTKLMSDNTALGVFDTDGSVLLSASCKKNTTKFKIVYCLEQSISKTDLVEKFANKFGSNARVNGQRAVFRAGYSNIVGERVRDFLLNNKPLNPGRRRDFLISEEVRKLLQQPRSTLNKIILIRLISNITVKQYNKKNEESFNKSISNLTYTSVELQQGIQNANKILASIEQEVAQLSLSLPAMKLSNEYAHGAHFGDGSLSVSLTFADPKRYRVGPTWSISGADEAYCKAFVNTFGGRLKTVKKHKVFCSYGLEASLQAISLLEQADWIPEYKAAQLKRFKEAVHIIKKGEHFTEAGLRKLVDLVVGHAEKGKPTKTKADYISTGLVCLRTLKHIS